MTSKITASGSASNNSPFRVEPPYEFRKPFTTEPQIRVGVILAEDKISRNSVTLPCRTKVSSADGKEITLPAATKVVFHTEDGALRVSSADQKELLASREKVSISPAENLPLRPQTGFLVEQVIAGRYYHWRKSISQYLPGSLELYPLDGQIQLINVLNFEDYLACVVTSEMSGDCPIDLIKAQVTAARSWSACFMDKHKGERYNVCNDDECQRYQGTTFLKEHVLKAVLDTKGEFLVFINELREQQIQPAFYSKSCGGFSELCEVAFNLEGKAAVSVFDGDSCKEQTLDLSDEGQFIRFLEMSPSALKHVYCNIPALELTKYLGGVDEAGEYFRWRYEAGADLLLNNLRNKYRIPDASKIIDLEPISNKPGVPVRGKGGRYHCFRVSCLGTDGKKKEVIIPTQYDVRSFFHESFLFSSAFTFQVKRNADGSVERVSLKGLGWGHGCGYCSIGAITMALKGKSYREILKHYFPKAELLRTY